MRILGIDQCSVDQCARPAHLGYVHIWDPQHPMAMANGYVAEHRKVAWDHGILIDPEQHVHHINHVKDDNRPSNLQALTYAEHARLHLEARR